MGVHAKSPSNVRHVSQWGQEVDGRYLCRQNEHLAPHDGGLGEMHRVRLFNELKPRKILHRGLARKGPIPGCPLSARRLGRPPSPQHWLALASGWLSHAGAALSGRGAGLQVAHTLTKRGSIVSTGHRCPNGMF